MHVDDLNVDSAVTIFPEDALGDAQSQATLIRLPGDVAASADGYIAYSRLCTHAGCPVALYRAASKELLCPCHQSVFDVVDNGAVVSGPADHALPRLPIEVGSDGILRATGDFPEAGRPGLLGTRMTNIERFLLWVDDRLGTAHFVRHALRKAFPDHWSFMLGEINMYVFGVLVATGTFLALFFDPNASQVVYRGPYSLLDGVRMSHAYASALALSFEVNAGLLVRQIHHWAALIFVAGILVHMGRIFFTGAFRKPREINWIIGVLLFWLALFAGFTGYSLPDDLLSGIGLRIAVSVALSVPVVGTWLTFFLIGGAYPTAQLIPRLFVLHIYLVPAAIAALIALPPHRRLASEALAVSRARTHRAQRRRLAARSALCGQIG